MSNHDNHFFLRSALAHIRITARARDLHRHRPLPQIPRYHLLRLIPQRRLLRAPASPSPSTAEHRTTLLSSSASNDIVRAARNRCTRVCATRGTTSPRCHRVRDSSTGSVSSNPASSSAYRSSSRAIPLGNPPSHIRRPLPYLDILPKKLPHQRPNPSFIPANLLRDRASPAQPPRSTPQPPPQRLHAAKYSQSFSLPIHPSAEDRRT